MTQRAAMRGSAPQGASERRPSSQQQQQRRGSTAAKERAAQSSRSADPRYTPLCVIGHGSFGVVMLADDAATGEKVAIKRVRYDPRLHNREVALLSSVLREAPVESCTCSATGAASSEAHAAAVTSVYGIWPRACHPNIVELLDSYISYDAVAAEGNWAEYKFTSAMPGLGRGGAAAAAAEAGYAYLEMVMSYSPMDLSELKRRYCHRPHNTSPSVNNSTGPTPRLPSPKASGRMPLRWVKIFLFQLARAMAFMHARGVCHRDLKPANILVDPAKGTLQLCDFGSAKQILRPAEEKNVSYICSRYYRAPELLFGALHYGPPVDMWSYGCLLAELLREGGHPLFRGCTSVDQMAELFKVMGAPSKREMYAMNPQCAAALLRTHAMRQPARASPGLGGHGPHDDFFDRGEEEYEDDGHVPMSAREVEERRTAGGMDEDSNTSPTFFAEQYDVLKIKAIPWRTLFPMETSADAVGLTAALLCYDPAKRLSAQEVVEHEFFDDLFSASTTTAVPSTPATSSEATCDAALRMPNGRLMPLEMFQLTATERQIFSVAFQAKMMAQAERLTAAWVSETATSVSS